VSDTPIRFKNECQGFRLFGLQMALPGHEYEILHTLCVPLESYQRGTVVLYEEIAPFILIYDTVAETNLVL
jgi:hypothetical protein